MRRGEWPVTASRGLEISYASFRPGWSSTGGSQKSLRLHDRQPAMGSGGGVSRETRPDRVDRRESMALFSTDAFLRLWAASQPVLSRSDLVMKSLSSPKKDLPVSNTAGVAD